MSSDPFSPDLPPRREPFDQEGYGADVPPLTGGAAGAARQRVQMPALFLIVVGVLNLLAALAAFGVGATFKAMPVAEFEKQLEQSPQNRQQLEDWKKLGYTMQDLLNVYAYGGFGGGAVALLASCLTILGGARMYVLKNYGLAVFASVLTALPCISPSACCLLGEGVGVWALAVLLSSDVRSAFR